MASGSAFPATLAFQIRELERQTNGDLKLDAIDLTDRRAPGPDQEIWQINSDDEEPTLFTPVAKPARRNFLAGEVIELVSTDDEELTPTRPTKRKRQVDQKSRKRPRASSAEESDQGPLTRPATPPPFSDAEDLLLAGNHDMDDVGIVEPDQSRNRPENHRFLSGIALCALNRFETR